MEIFGLRGKQIVFLLAIILLSVFIWANYTEHGKNTVAWMRENALVVMLGIGLIVGIYLYSNGQAKLWAEPNETIEASFRGGYLSYVDFDEGFGEPDNFFRYDREVRVHKIEPKFGWLFVGYLFTHTKKHSILLSGNKLSPGQHIDHWEGELTFKQIEKLQKDEVPLEKAMETLKNAEKSWQEAKEATE